MPLIARKQGKCGASIPRFIRLCGDLKRLVRTLLSCDTYIQAGVPRLGRAHDGRVWGYNPGTATIRAEWTWDNSIYAESVVTVLAPIPVTGILVTPPALQLREGSHMGSRGYIENK